MSQRVRRRTQPLSAILGLPNNISAVLTDTDMPNGVGFEVVKFCDKIKIPVLMMSGIDITERTPSQQTLVGGRFVIKPFQPREIVEKIRGMLLPAVTQA